jgi:hypothetical protein
MVTRERNSLSSEGAETATGISNRDFAGNDEGSDCGTVHEHDDDELMIFTS